MALADNKALDQKGTPSSPVMTLLGAHQQASGAGHPRIAMPHQAADAIVTLVHGDRMPSSSELLGGRKPCGPGSHDSNCLAGLTQGLDRLHRATLETLIDD